MSKLCKPISNQIICGECAEIMADWPNDCIDLTVTSPPYDNLRDYEGYDFNFETIANQLWRITKPGGVIVWIVADQTIDGTETLSSFRQALFFRELGFNVETMIYEKAQACFGSNHYYLQSFEYMFVFSKGKPKSLNLLRDRRNKRSGTEWVSKSGLHPNGTKPKRHLAKMQKYGKRKNIWRYGVGGGKIDHPAIFPEALARDHILSWSNCGDLVLDPMCGSGTTCKMAKQTGRGYIGIDVSEKYCITARRRVLEAQPPLFTQEQEQSNNNPKVKQLSLHSKQLGLFTVANRD